MKKTIALLVAVLMLVAMPITAFAAESPTADVKHTVTIVTEGVVGGAATASPATVTQGENTVLKATPQDGYKFAGWVIEGDYGIVAGSLDAVELTITPNGDVKVTPKFVSVGGTATSATTTKANDSSKSPSTGETSIVAGGVSIMAMAAVAFVLVSAKKKEEICD